MTGLLRKEKVKTNYIYRVMNMAYKTNVMRILDKAKVEYKSHTYANTNAISGIEVASVLNQNPKQVFKTLVTVGKTNKYYVFLVPVADELDFKKAADCVNEKAIEMLKATDLLPITGYIHGGCSPIGMKKNLLLPLMSRQQILKQLYLVLGKLAIR
ncbi:hypothetical protein N752_23890 [Desulforamulus aquiferis]|nr:hypothetical protein N752_23890 [Desulforamulus aquiferis]